jgi:hypothetical protein
MEPNGWQLFQYPLFENQLQKLTEAVEQLSFSRPDTYKERPKTKLLATIHRYVTEIIPRDLDGSGISARRYIGTR